MRNVLLLGGLAVLMLSLSFSCSLRLRDDTGEKEGDGRYIKLQIQAPRSAKGIKISDFQVTDLEIAVRGPDGETLETIAWAAADGPQSYLVAVQQPGMHEIEVTHIGECNGQVKEAVESASFDIQAMLITVIEIVPGCIGLIEITSDGLPWIVGCWVQSIMSAPHTTMLEFRAAGAWFQWGDYLGSIESEIETYGTWSLEGSLLSVCRTGFGCGSGEIGIQSQDEFVIPGTPAPGAGLVGTWYRRGTEPGYWVFEQTAVPLSAGALIEGDVATQGMDLYVFTATEGGSYGVEFKADGLLNPEGIPYTLHNVDPVVYAADQLTMLSLDWNEEEEDLDAVAMNAGDLIYLVVDPGYPQHEGGTYALMVHKVQ